MYTCIHVYMSRYIGVYMYRYIDRMHSQESQVEHLEDFPLSGGTSPLNWIPQRCTTLDSRGRNSRGRNPLAERFAKELEESHASKKRVRSCRIPGFPGS